MKDELGNRMKSNYENVTRLINIFKVHEYVNFSWTLFLYPE